MKEVKPVDDEGDQNITTRRQKKFIFSKWLTRDRIIPFVIAKTPCRDSRQTQRQAVYSSDSNSQQGDQLAGTAGICLNANKWLIRPENRGRDGTTSQAV